VSADAAGSQPVATPPTAESGRPTVTLTLARFTPEDAGDWLTSATAILSPEERSRSAAMAGVERQTQRAVGRALLRLRGARACGCLPAEVEIATSEQGKPWLLGAPAAGVSLAHSGHAVLLASCPSQPVGADIEPPPASVVTARRLAMRRFSAEEATAGEALADAAFGAWFTRAWTTKEAVGKALGVGIAPALSGAVVTLDADTLASVWSGPPAHRWTLAQLPAPGGDEQIAVAVPAPDVSVEPVTVITLEEFTRATAQPAIG
jgi:4'-phosphopantetheinyl transferase